MAGALPDYINADYRMTVRFEFFLRISSGTQPEEQPHSGRHPLHASAAHGLVISLRTTLPLAIANIETIELRHLRDV